MRYDLAYCDCCGAQIHGQNTRKGVWCDNCTPHRRTPWFFLGWCAGVMTIVLALWLAPYVDACDELPPPDETIKQIKVITV